MPRFQPGAFNRLIASMGQNVAWEPASLCPCRSAFEGSPTPNCAACAGKGVIWSPAQDVRIAPTTMKASKEYAAFGQWEAGDVLLTLPEDSPAWEAGESDRFTMVDSSVPFRRVQTRGDSNEAYGAHILEITRAFYVDSTAARPAADDDGDPPAGGTPGVTECSIPTWTAAGQPSWPAGTTAPPAGKQYSVVGRRRPIYFMLMELPQDRAHHQGMRLPRKVAARRFDLFGR